MEGTSIGNWVLERKLADGGMGVVYLARHKTTGASAAVKALFPSRVPDAQMLEIFHQEARTQMKLRHPHIAQAHDYQEVNGQYYLVLEHLHRSLADVIEQQQGPIEMTCALTWTKQLLFALDYAHQQGVIHRDIKPANVMLDEHEQVKVTDFGIALEMGGKRVTETGMTKGTPEYMSPEQIVRPREVDHRTDVYSAGILLYELLTGRVPFTGPTHFAVQEAQVKYAPPKLRSLNPRIPEKLEAIVLRALEKDPARRFNGCGEFARSLEAFIVEEPPLPRPRRKFLVMAASAVAFVAVLGIGYSFWPAQSLMDKYFALREEVDRRWTPQEAVQEYQDKLRKEAKNPLWQAMLAQAWSNQDNFKEAEAALKKAIELEPNEPLWQSLLGDLRHRQSNKSEAQSAYQRAASMTTNEADRNLFLGFSSYALEKWAEAEAYYRKAIELNPKRPWPHNYLGVVLGVQKKWPEAEAAYRKAISFASDAPRFHYGLGVTLDQQKKADEALAAFKKATELAPKNPGYQNSLGNFYFTQQKWPEAEAAYQRAVNFDPHRAVYQANLGGVLQKQQKYAEAETAYAKSTEIAPKNDSYFNGLGEARFAQKKWAQAETAWQQAVNLKANNATYQGNLANAKWEQQKYSEAATAYAEALRLAPQNDYYANRLGRSRWELYDWSGAETAFRTAVNLKPSEPAYHNNLGLALEKQKWLSLAGEEFKKAMELDSKNPTYRENYERVQSTPWVPFFNK